MSEKYGKVSTSNVQKISVLDVTRIIETARCVIDLDGTYLVSSPDFDMLLGAATTEGRAWKVFFELLDDLMVEYKKGKLEGYGSRAAKLLGREGGIARTPAKQAAARANGAKGGRPKKT